MEPAPCAAAVVASVVLSMPVQAQVRFEQKADRILVEVNGRPFTVLHYGAAVGKPYLHPLLTASGKAITRGFPDDPLPGDPTDRPHLRGLIIGHEKVSTASGGAQDFWENDPAPFYDGRRKGKQVVAEAVAVGGLERGAISMVVNWTGLDGQVWIVERRKLTFYSKPNDSRMIDVEIDLESREDVTYGDEKDAILSLRFGLPFTNHMEGKAVSSRGGINEAGIKGHRAAWVDWQADLAGEKVGVAVFDHPSNRNYPNRWHEKDFGQVIIGPFGGRIYAEYATADPKAQWDDWSLEVPRGEHLKLKYRVLIHPAAGKPAGQLVNDIQRIIDGAERPLVDQRVYDSFNEWSRSR